MSNIPETSDTEFTWDSFQSGINSDLANVLGNFVSRVTKFSAKRFGAVVPDGPYGPSEAALVADLSDRVKTYASHWEEMEIRKAAAELRAIWVAGNEYLQAAAPWAAPWTSAASRAREQPLR